MQLFSQNWTDVTHASSFCKYSRPFWPVQIKISETRFHIFRVNFVTKWSIRYISDMTRYHFMPDPIDNTRCMTHCSCICHLKSTTRACKSDSDTSYRSRYILPVGYDIRVCMDFVLQKREGWVSMGRNLSLWAMPFPRPFWPPKSRSQRLDFAFSH